jgi:hypothetical protein
MIKHGGRQDGEKIDKDMEGGWTEAGGMGGGGGGSEGRKDGRNTERTNDHSRWTSFGQRFVVHLID